MLKFFYNGIKGSDGKLQKASYSIGNWATKPASMIRIYGKNYENFSDEIHQAFKVEDGTDLMTDYFENQHIDVYETHPLYAEVKTALLKQEAHKNIRWEKKGPIQCFCGSIHIYGSCQRKLQEVA
jgi:hypothetical protein